MHRPRRLPSLHALRVFEAAARHLSFTRAGRELRVTQAAVSHQVKVLEDELGQALFVRHTRALTLTDAGRAYLPQLTAALDAIEEATDRARAGAGRARLTMSIVPSFGARWLLPRLPRFRAAHPEIDLHVSLSTELVDLAKSGFDLGIRWGSGRYPGLAVWHILDDALFPLVSPKLWRRKSKFEPARDLPRLGLLHDEGHEQWERWLERAGVLGVPVDSGVVVNDASLLLQAAVEGLGVALGRRSLAASDLATGRLVRLSRLALKTPEAYWLVARKAAADEPKVRRFREWLLGEAARRSIATT